MRARLYLKCLAKLNSIRAGVLSADVLGKMGRTMEI